jgi:hypothetical protein
LPPNAERIAAHLLPAEVEAVREWCRRTRTPSADWPLEAPLAGFVDISVFRAVDAALQARRARSFTAALKIVAGDLGLSFDALDRRYRRQRTRRKKTDTVSAAAPASEGRFRP